MPTIRSADADIYYETHGAGTPVMLIAGLAGVGATWGPQVGLFAKKHTVILPDHRGTGRSSHTTSGLTISQHAADFAALVRHLGIGPVHAVGSSTGGAIAQMLALEQPDVVKTISIVSSWSRGDAFFRRQFNARAQMLNAAGVRAATDMGALFLFDPRFQMSNPKAVEAWADAAAAGASAPEIGKARIDMILGYDRLDQLGAIKCPTLIFVGESDFCTPPHMSEAMAAKIPGAEFAKMPGGHFFFIESPDAFHDRVEAFIARHGG
ncbi:MAG: alpha/beta fold hydrolase [Hyphomicrobiaceae bacterium]